jgi:two-component system, LytTR family, response regulator
MMRVLIVDDEPLARLNISERLSAHPNLAVVGECDSGTAAIEGIQKLGPDLVFLDIQLPDLSGFDVLRKLSPPLPAVIFITAYDCYAVNAFEIHALDYLLKPIDDDRFNEAIERAYLEINRHHTSGAKERLRNLLHKSRDHLEPRYPAHFAVRTGNKINIVRVDDIDRIEAAGDYVTLHAGGKNHLLRRTMNETEAQLNPERFLRIHRSLIVRTSGIRELVTLSNHEFRLRMSDGTEQKVSRTYSDRVERWLG